MKKNLFTLVAVSLQLFSSCNSDEPHNKIPVSTYFIASTASTDTGPRPNLSTFDYNSGRFVRTAFQAEAIHEARFQDFVIHESSAYATTSDGYLLKIDINTLNEQKRVNTYAFSREELYVYKDHLIASGWHWDRFAYLKFYDSNLNLLDSITFPEVNVILDVNGIEDRIFLSLRKHVNGILVLDAVSHKPIDELDLGSPECTDLIALDHETLLLIRSQNILSVNPETLEIKKTIELWSNGDGATTSANYYAFNERDNLLYYFAANAQPAPVPLRLQSVNLTTGTTETLSGFEDPFYPPIAYDPNNENILVTTLAGEVTILDEEGVLIKTLQALNSVSKIIIREY